MNIHQILEQYIRAEGIPNGTDVSATIDFDIRDAFAYIRFFDGTTIAIDADGSAELIQEKVILGDVPDPITDEYIRTGNLPG